MRQTCGTEEDVDIGVGFCLSDRLGGRVPKATGRCEIRRDIQRRTVSGHLDGRGTEGGHARQRETERREPRHKESVAQSESR